MNVTVFVGGKSLFTAQGAPEAAAGFYGLATHSDGALAGWYEAPAPRVEEVLRPQANGAFMPHNLLLGARIITLHFYYVATSLNDGVASHQKVMSVANQKIRLVVLDDDGQYYHVRGYVSQQPVIKRLGPLTWAYTLIITCADPLKYAGVGFDDLLDFSEFEHLGGRWGAATEGGLLFPLFDQAYHDLVASTRGPTARFTDAGYTNALAPHNRGNLAVWPILEADGPLYWAEWAHNGRAIRYEGHISSGQSVRVDSRTGRVYVGEGEVSTAHLTKDEFFQLEPGDNTVTFSASDSTNWRVRWLASWT